MVQISLQNSDGKVVFLGPPLGKNGSKSSLVTFKWQLKSVKNKPMQVNNVGSNFGDTNLLY